MFEAAYPTLTSFGLGILVTIAFYEMRTTGTLRIYEAYVVWAIAQIMPRCLDVEKNKVKDCLAASRNSLES